ncbi:hypothetical protein GW758_04595 [Candidatus Falkowbacteria bacterium]|nr:hypothetical protein [Candidatus Falkowbacteria bacterium]NCT55198.1 hypothetical protein [Candidatus Falkowbacteria bacterium]
MKNEFFSNQLPDLIDELKSANTKTGKIDLIRSFIASLPGAMLVEDEILPLGVVVKGCVILCSEEEYLNTPEEQRGYKKIDFEFKITQTQIPLAKIEREKIRSFVGLWHEALERLIKEMTPEVRKICAN